MFISAGLNMSLFWLIALGLPSVISFAEESPSGHLENIIFLEKFIGERAKDISTEIAYGTPDDRISIDIDGDQSISLREDGADKESSDLGKYHIRNLIPDVKKNNH